MIMPALLERKVQEMDKRGFKLLVTMNDLERTPEQVALDFRESFPALDYHALPYDVNGDPLKNGVAIYIPK